MAAGAPWARRLDKPPGSLAEGGKGLFAVLETGGKQHKVQPGSVLRVEKLEVSQGEQVTFDRILAVGDGEQTVIGTPLVEGASVLARVLQQGKAHKIIVFKYKAKKNYRRKKGHRQLFTEIRVREIVCPGFTGGQADAGAGAGKPALKTQQPPEQEIEQPDSGGETAAESSPKDKATKDKTAAENGETGRKKSENDSEATARQSQNDSQTAKTGKASETSETIAE